MIEVKCRWIFPLMCIVLLSLAACQKEKEQTMSGEPKEMAATEKEEKAQMFLAVAELKPTAGNEVSGSVTFSSSDGAVRIVAELMGLEPGKHGFHIHDKGDCSAPDATSAGGHFNPANTPHGAPENPPAQRHVGDLGNLEADAEGMAHYERVDGLISLEGPDSIVGRAVVVHAGPDDLTSQTSGNAGPRVACGVIQGGE